MLLLVLMLVLSRTRRNAGTGTQTNVIEAYKWYVLYGEYATDVKNKQQLLSLLPQIEKSLTPTQNAEAIKRAFSFQKTRCVP